MAINDNCMDLSKYRGAIVACPFCPPITDQITSRAACSKCLGHRFIALCLNCDHTGQFKGRTVWDGGANAHTSTCTPCGGNGFFPSKGPATARYQPPTKSGDSGTVLPLDQDLPVAGQVSMPMNAPDGAHVVESVASDTVPVT